MSDIIDPSKLKVAELRAELQERGLDHKGNKPVLIERLREALEQESATEAGEQGQEDEGEKEIVETEEQENVEDEEDKDVVQEETVEEEQEQVSETVDAPAEEEKEDPPVAVVEEENDEKHDENSEKQEEKHLDDLNKENEEVDDEDKSAVDLIKDDFFNGHTEEMEDLEEEADDKEEMEVEEEKEVKKDTVKLIEEKKEVIIAKEDFKEEAKADVDGENDESWDHKRGTKRAASPVPTEDKAAETDQPSKRARPDAEVSIIAQEEEPFDQSLVVLDWYNSDLSLKIEKTKRLSATPMSDKGFAFMWHGARATYGFTKGLVCFEVLLECNTDAMVKDEVHPYVLRVGWSVDDSSFTLGEDQNSWGYGGTAIASNNLKFKDYGCKFKTGDVVGAYLNLDVSPAVITFTVNGTSQGVAHEIDVAGLEGKALFPHILTKNVQFKVNFGDEEPFSQVLDGYTYVGKVPIEDRVLGTTGPATREDCEVIMMVGLPAVGKTTYVSKYRSENKQKKYTVISTNDLIDKMKVNGLPRKRNYAGRWDQLISMCNKCLNELLRVAYNRNRNYIIDQTNVYPTAQKRKIRGFLGFYRRAVVICPTDEQLKERSSKREKEEGKDVPDSAVLEMKANYKLPEVGEFFDAVDFIELQKEEAQKLVAQYNKEGTDANPDRYGNSGPQDWSSLNNRGGGRGQGFGGRRDFSGGDRRDNNRGFRGGWDRDRDRRGGYDRRGGGGNWNNNNNNNRNRDFGGRLGNRDNRGGGGGYYNRNNSSNYRGYNNRDNYRGGNKYGNNSYGNRYQQGDNSNSTSGYGSGGYGGNSHSSQSYQQAGYPQQQQSSGYGSWNSGGYYGQQQNYYAQQQQAPQSQTSYGNWGHQTQGVWNAPSTGQAAGTWGGYGQHTGQPPQQNWNNSTQGGYGNYNYKK